MISHNPRRGGLYYNHTLIVQELAKPALRREQAEMQALESSILGRFDDVPMMTHKELRDSLACKLAGVSVSKMIIKKP